MSKVKVTIYITEDQNTFLNDFMYKDFQKNKKLCLKKGMLKARNSIILDLIEKFIDAVSDKRENDNDE